MKKNEVNPELVKLVLLLNNIKGLYTTECCVGHGKSRCQIWFRVETFDILKEFAKKCLDCFKGWEIIMDHFDMKASENIPGEEFHLECIYQGDLLKECIVNLEKAIKEEYFMPIK